MNEGQRTNRRRLEARMRVKMPRVRLDADMPDRAVALQLLAAHGVNAETTPALMGMPLSRCSDAYVIQYALCVAGDDAPIAHDEWRSP